MVVAADETRRAQSGRLGIFRIDAIVADMRIRQRDDLPFVARIRQDFLISGQRSVEDHFTRAMRSRSGEFSAESFAAEEMAVLKYQDAVHRDSNPPSLGGAGGR